MISHSHSSAMLSTIRYINPFSQFTETLRTSSATQHFVLGVLLNDTMYCIVEAHSWFIWL
jgi:hypothetical protein